MKQCKALSVGNRKTSPKIYSTGLGAFVRFTTVQEEQQKTDCTRNRGTKSPIISMIKTTKKSAAIEPL